MFYCRTNYNLLSKAERGFRLLREVLCDFFFGENEYGSTPEKIDRYFLVFGRDGKATNRRMLIPP